MLLKGISEDERQTAREFFPPYLYLPAGQLADERGPSVEYRTLADGRVAVMAYTSLDRLARGMGSNQPWLVYPSSELTDLQNRVHFDLVLFDVTLPQEDWR